MRISPTCCGTSRWAECAAKCWVRVPNAGKHRHARDSLEHYRTSSKEQREQENRRHEQLVQGLQTELRQAQLAATIKQEELTRLNKEAAALVAELGSSKQALHLEREAGRSLARKVEQLQAGESRIAVLEVQLVESSSWSGKFENAASLKCA
jgi:hypothetical protein